MFLSRQNNKAHDKKGSSITQWQITGSFTSLVEITNGCWFAEARDAKQKSKESLRRCVLGEVWSTNARAPGACPYSQSHLPTIYARARTRFDSWTHFQSNSPKAFIFIFVVCLSVNKCFYGQCIFRGSLYWIKPIGFYHLMRYGRLIYTL